MIDYIDSDKQNCQSQMSTKLNTKFPAHSSALLLTLRIAAICYFLFTLYALFHPHPHLESVGIPTFSFIHTAAFFVLGFIFELARGRFSLWTIYIFLFLYGPVTEIIQPFTGRFFEWSDIVEDILGVTLGFFTALAIKTLLKTHLGQNRTRTPLTENKNSIESNDVAGQ